MMKSICSLLLALTLAFSMVMAQVSPVRAAGTDLTLTKTIEGGATTAQVGDIIRYRIHFACSNLTTPCGPMEITDVLQAGLTYIPAQSSVPAGFTMTESPAGTITITKDDNNLLDGSQYDAVIAVMVNYDLRPLPATINNTVTGRIAPTGLPNWENTTPASAPPITVNGVASSWQATKTLSSPSIDPTVDTDVTYQIQLCPVPPAPYPAPGNVGLSNIVITDTLPTGAAFVSASDGGSYAPGPGTVTWSVAGPVYPPNCVTRYVTIRYNSPSGTPPGPFLVGNNVTNTVDYDADYVPSTGTCTTPCTGGNNAINHPIDPISEVPTYSKDDVGDPIGFTGTGRFTLNLDTNNTNYPPNNLILVDNLPPQLRVLSVTSGGWPAAFQHVRAHIEYSTNNGSSYTAFAGSPALYNTNATYAAPATNITNVRWRFEYDPDGLAPYTYTQQGLPYTWSFTSSPEIRVTPRATPVSTDPPTPVILPAAVAGNTYTNCVQTTRTDSGGSPITDPCDNETMTVQGNLVSLRASKNETPGAPWDDLDDPTILTFTPDTKILPGDTIRYTLTLELTERSSENLVNPTIQDTLPGDGASPFGLNDFIFVRNGSATLDGGAVVQPVFTQVGQVLKWEWPALTVTPLPLGSRYLTVEFYGYVPRGQDPGTYTNNLYAVTDSTEVVCEIGSQIADSGDVDTDGNTAEFGCRNPDPYVVERSAALRGEKWIRSTSPDNSQVVLASTFLPNASCPNGGTVGLTSIPTNPFTRYPCISQAFPEGALSPNQFAPPPTDNTLDDFEYNLRVFNDGNVPMLEYVLYDILPRVGDTGSGGVLANSARASEFRPSMTGPIQFIQGPGGLTSADFTIEYNLTTNPCRPEVFDQPVGATVPGGCDNTWVLAGGVADWTLVRSYRIRLNNDGSLPSPSIANAVPAGSELRFGVPMNIPSDAPPTGFDTDDVLSREIAWNSFAHVGSYDKDGGAPVVIEDLLASEPRKVGITVPERMSVGNRVWRDADNSGTINAPDDTTPGIANVLANLYRDVNNDGIPDGPAIGSTLTDTEGYYLFSNIPYDSGNMNNNRYIIGIPASNFDNVGDPLYQLRSSTGTPATATYVTPTSNTVDSADDGIDPAIAGQEVLSWAFTLQPGTEPTAEADLSNNNRDGLPGQRRGVNGERDNNSDLTLDFGFFGGSDVPFSIGNHVWKDNGQGGGVINDGIRQATEPPVIGALVRLYRDGNANGIPEPAEMIRTDITDANGFYLFDNLDPGPYYVEIPASNFAAGQPLAGWYSSQVTGTENVGVPGNPYTPSMDSDDNGIDNNFPEVNGIFSGVIVLTRNVNEATGETHLSGDTSSAPGFNPTAGDGPGSIGRFGEVDTTSNVTVDFGFIPPMSLGNRVWFDEGAGTTPFRTGYDNGLQDGTETGVNGVTVQLWRDTDGTPGLQIATDSLMYTTTTDATGYYLFERLQPGNNYFVRIPTSNFTGGGALVNYLSSTDANQTTPPADNTEDIDDNGVDNAAPATNGINSTVIAMSYNGEPLTPANETDINTSGTYGPNNVGNFGQEDNDSNLTIDFGFVRPPRSLGNRVWYDPNNNGVIDAGDDFDSGTPGDQPGIPGVRVSLYLDTNTDNVPDDLGAIGDRTDDWVAFDMTDAEGYYLFDKLPPGIYIVGVDRVNFTTGNLLEEYNSSRGSVDNAANNTNQLDNGVDRLLRADPVASPHGIIATRINLTATPVGAPTTDDAAGTISTDTGIGAGFNPTFDDGPLARGRFGEADNNSDLTLDFGFFVPMSLGNRVWIDDGAGGGVYNNGIMDGAELPRANVRVELYRDANTDGVPDAGLVDFDITDTNGFYLFDDLAAGSYVVVIPSGNFAASFDPDGGGPLPTAAGALLGYNTSTPTGTENVGVAGNPYTPNTDRDDNGLNVGTAPTTGGVRSGTITLALTTEAIGETELSGQANPGAPTNDDFSPTGWDGPTPGSRGRWGETDANSNLTIDFGFIPVYALGNRVFFDTNNNSLRNGAEVGVNNVRVRLYDSTGTTEILVGADGILYTADDGPNGMLTAGGGYYRFNNLPAGDYLVRIPASNFGAGQPLLGTWSSATTISNAGVISETAAPDADTTVTDSDDNGTLASGNVDSLPVTLGPLTTPEPLAEPDLSGGQGQPDAQANMTVDFGFYTITLGNQVWGDVNNNGLLDGGELGINGVTVQLWSQDLSTMLGTTTTAGGGAYTFTGLAQGNYIVRLPASNFNPGGALEDYRSSTGAVPPSTYEPAPNPDAVTTDSDDNGTETGGILGAGGYVQTSAFALTPNAEQSVNNATGLTTENRVDFGVVDLVALGNRVWFDTGAGAFFNNGILDAGETPVNNVTVQLFNFTTGVEVPVGPDGILGTGDDAPGGVQTSGGGYYRFDRLYPGTYYVQIPATEFQAGGDLFGYVSSIGAGANETSDNNADENGIDVATLTTTGIRSQNYILQANTEQTGEDQTNYTGLLDDNNVNFTADFGFTQLVAIGNRVWIDDGTGGGVTNDGIQNGSEPGVDGVTVELYTSGGVLVASTTTSTVSGQPGTYQFTNLNPGDYYVHIPASMFDATLPSPLQGSVSSTGNGVNETSDHDADENGIDASSLATTGISTQVFTLSVGGETTTDDETTYTGYLADANVNFTADFGFLQKVAIGNVVWHDNGAGGGTPNDGIQNGTEPGIQFVDLQIYRVGDTPGVSTPVQTTTSGVNGYYVFDDLTAGDYFIFIPAAEFQTGGTLENYRSSTGNGANETTDQSGDENGIDDVSAAVNGIRSTNYTLQPNGEQTGEPQPNYTGALDDDNVNFTADFGFAELVALGNRVWFDTGAGAFYNNGILDAGETPVNNVTVQLYTSAGVEVPVGPDGILGTGDDALGGVQTSGGGYYRFDRLYPGTYYVQIPATEFQAGGDLFGYVSSLGAGANETNDNNLDENGIDVATLTTTGIRTQNYTLLPNTEPSGEDQTNYAGLLDDNNVNFTADFGFTQLVAIGNRIWFDVGNGGGVINDGIQNGAEAGVNLVDVELYRVGDTPGVTVPVATTTTDASGNYQFTNLNPGDYFVHIPASEFQAGQPLEGSVSSTGNGSNETSDQDADENGIDTASLATNGISSTPYTLTPNTETAADDETSYTGYLDDDNVNFTVDFGFLQKVAIGNVAWLDNGAGGGTANDGIQNGTEPGIPGVDLQLFNVGDVPGVDAPVKTTSSGVNGYYVFDDLIAGDYFIFIPAAEFQTGGTLENVRSSTGNGANETTDQNGDENGIDNASAATNGITSTNYTLQPNSEQTGEPQPNYTGALDDDNVNFTADFGFTELVALGNRVWFDTGAGAFFNNGILDAGETTVNNVTVQLFTSTGVEVPVGPDGILGTGDDAPGGVQTSGGGYYRFDRLYPGTYYVQIPATEFQAGGDLFSYVSSLGAGANETGDNDADENGIDVATLTTTGIRSQDYILQPNTERTGEDQTNYAGALDDDNVNFTADFGFTQLVGIGNRIWFDTGNGGGTSNDGIQNGAETGVNNVDVELYRVGDTPGVTTPVATTATDASGNYQFTNLNPGDYFVHIPASEFQAGQPLEGYVSSTGNGSDETSDQDADENGIDAASLATNGISSTPYTLQPNTERTGEDQASYTGYLDDDNVNFTADFGFLQKVAIGNVVWLDNGAGGGTVNDGIQNGTEPGVPGVDLQLYLVGNTPGVDTPVKTTTSVANGYYVFDDLLPGDYFIFIPATEFQSGGTLASYRSSVGNGVNETTDQTGDENGIDDAAAAVNGIRSTNYTLQPNSEQTVEPQPNYTGALDDDNVNFTADFGFTEAYSIGNRVWFDTDNSGAINGSEVGVPGVTVQLYAADALGNPTGAVLRTTVTVAGGYYLFDDLYGGDYVVVLPTSNFTGAGVLTGYWSSGTAISPAGVISEALAPDADLNVDSDDNGTLQTGGAFAGAVIAQNVVLGPTGDTEPASESDLQSVVGQGNQPDARANMTVDFGFYRVELGNLVFTDLDSNGAFNGTDTPYFNVQVRLYSADGTTEIPVGLDGVLGTADDNIGGMFTNGSGLYLFSNLPAGNYIVSVVTPAGASSTIDTFNSADNANPDTNINNNDNGVGIGTGEVFSTAVSLTPGNVGAQNGNTVTNSTGTTSNPTVDFGFVTTTYSLGNRVWFDTNNNSLIDSGEVGVNGVVVELYAADLAGNPISPALTSDTTTNGGYYLFDNLVAGDYVVAISASNFAPGGVLNGYWSSATTMDLAGAISEIAAPDPDLGSDNAVGGGDDDRDSDDNGTRQTAGAFSNAVLSLPVTLGPGNIEPTGESDLESGVGQGTPPDLRANMTVDFGFYRVGVGNLVFVDVNANGTYDTGDATISGATVQLFTSNGTEINVGPDGILGTGDDAPGGMTTSASGTYTFTGLAQGDYIVVVTPVVGFTSTVDTADSADSTDANTNTDNNDNGIGVGIGQVTSSVVTLTPGDTGTASNNTVNNNNGTTSNPTLDFGFVSNNGALTKRLIDTNESFTTGTDVAIGEIVTYEVSINLPLGTPLTNVTLTDRMDKGLAFVDCLLVEVAGVNQTGTVCPPAVSAIVDPADAATNPANPGRQVVFTVGDIPAQTTATTLVIRYRAIVLDVIENQNGGVLNNSATWAWTGGSFTTSAENVEIVEPDLTIDKAADPVSNVAIGTPVQFTLTIAHTAQSTSDAFDVVITDILPPTLAYIPCTIIYSGLAPTTPAPPAYCPGTTTDLIFHWDTFPLGSTATITFNAQLVGSPATNSASVEWTSLPIDPGLDGLPIELSDYNEESIERWYDPLDDVNVYVVSDSVDINGDGLGGGGDDEEESEGQGLSLPTTLPATGFAPNMVTQLPAQPAEKAYKATDVWLEIPSLGVKLPIVGVPLADGDWDVSWLWKEAGWLDGTAFPGWQGNSVLTSHVTLPDGNAGPFADLGKLKWGDRIIIHAYGAVYVYEVRQNRTVSPYNATVLQHEEEAWLTLLTCKTYNEDTGTYSSRIAVRAVLAGVREDTSSYGSNNVR